MRINAELFQLGLDLIDGKPLSTMLVMMVSPISVQIDPVSMPSVCAASSAAFNMSSMAHSNDWRSMFSPANGWGLPSSAFITLLNSLEKIRASRAFSCVSVGEFGSDNAICCCNVIKACNETCRGVPEAAWTASCCQV